jgi:hypothetical protein
LRITASVNIAVSSSIAWPSAGVNVENASPFSCAATSSTSSHCWWNIAIVVRARGSFKSRSTCAVIVASSLSVPFAASENSVSSGIELHRKYDSRDASSHGESATVPGLIVPLAPTSW